MARPNIYQSLKTHIVKFDKLIDVGCYGFYDIFCFENTLFKSLIGIDKRFDEKPFSFYYRYKRNQIEDKNIVIDFKQCLNDFTERFNFEEIDLFNYDFISEEFSFLICNKVLHFYNEQQKLELIERFHNSLQPEGLMYLKLNHNRNANNTNLKEVDLIDINTYQNKIDKAEIRYLIEPNIFLQQLKFNYHLIDELTFVDEKTLTVVIRK